jgi:hypothetical protein
MIFVSIVRNYAENRKLRGRLLITRSVSRPRNRVLGWALMIGGIEACRARLLTSGKQMIIFVYVLYPREIM